LNVITFAPWLILVPILTFFFLKDVNQIRLAVLRLFPPGRWRVRVEAVLQDVNTTLAAYTRAQLISCFIIGVICTAGFYIIGLKYALLLGILAAIFEFVPLLGPLALAVIATTTAAFSDNPWRALYVAIFLLTLRLIHDYFTYPRIVRGGIHLHPLLIILSVLAGEQVAGIPGVFLAIPVVALFTVIYKHVLEHRGGQRLFDGLAERDVAEETVT
jgi:predicted PurR-regulated permease PerM